MKTRHRLSVFSMALVVAWPAAAQQAAGAAPEDETQRIVITANKRLEKQRDQAGTVSVLQGSDLERRGARDQEDSFKLTPGVQFNKGDIASNTITIRGIGTSTTNEGSGAQQGPTGQYLEDVPLASPQGKGTVYDPLTWDLDRVEVLRGPQGVLFGSGSLGGAVRYLFNKPDLKNFDASVKGEYARVSEGAGAFSVYGMLNAPIQTDVLGLRVVAYDRKDPGYIDNLGTRRKDANDLQQRGGRVLLTARPTKDLTATLVVSSQKTKQGDTFSVSPDRTRLEHTAPNDSRRETTTDFTSLTIDADLGGLTLTSITGHRKNKGQNLIDDTELFASVGLALPQVYRPQTGSEKATSQELRVANKPGGRFSYVVGAFYQTSKSNSNGQQIDPSGAFGITTLVDLTSNGAGTEKALFADGEFQLGGGWSVGAGGRYYRTTTESTTTGTQFGAPSNVGPLSSNDSGFTPKLSAKYRFGDNQWYATVAKGYRYGGRNGPPTNDEYKSDSLWSYETGVRLNPAAGLQADLSVFLLDWKEAQFTFFERIGGTLPNSRIGNVGKARSTGVEVALKYRISSVFDVAASLAYMDAETKASVTIPSGGPTSITVGPGARLPGTPKLQAALQANARFAGPFDSQGRVNATYTHVGDRVMFLGGNKPADAYDTLDLGLQFTRDKLTLAAGLANATNEKGVLSITGAPAGVGPFAQYFLQRPRTLTVSLRYDF
ncbi:MAG: TonB-dependent receptor [Burkholderiaceae bacterium]|jgi:outer membrane receptor protein involved in Fe transport|nr:TonB-dependent receptor [Burkholderiaceae bacterium]MCZ8177355.1 TonB-dependent receptor [Burkholderiaceae bacterium]